jgi:hypothetical protein
MTAEVMLMVRDEMIFRLIECRPVIQWLDVWDAAHRDLSHDSEHKQPEKHFLLVSSQSIITNPIDFDLPADNPHVLAWLGNNTLCYMRGKKIVFNHANWFVFSSIADCAVTDKYSDSQEESEPEDAPGHPAAAFLDHDY